ncbi:hypothetical protein CC80DRAFT_539095 [Byssothecium circinans]|uniref:Uncharacterized protein n=1 Tax=Byssothecium circinans TaxID=147558 RepID=A0A6A5TQI5_9PLEO|nr:hypothetical protein CC80DRAFT_539095 [Byssothecium circinans]
MPPPPPSPLPTLFLTEAVLKVLAGATFLLFPTSILQNLSPEPFSPSSLALVRSFGTQTIAFGIPLFLTARADAGTRRLVYATLLAREGFLAVGLLGQVAGLYFGVGREGGGSGGEGEVEGQRERLLEEGRVGKERDGVEDRRVGEEMLRRGLGVWVVEVLPFVVGRVWVLGWRGEWF